ncbi:MAG: hypothetical protein J3K34DRAFT_191217 [Monoraphidium minutum]|nr:MAG: hypothetical protein J3K34DRAFT_191217 [Monoraphidium minutum]
MHAAAAAAAGARPRSSVRRKRVSGWDAPVLWTQVFEAAPLCDGCAARACWPLLSPSLPPLATLAFRFRRAPAAAPVDLSGCAAGARGGAEPGRCRHTRRAPRPPRPGAPRAPRWPLRAPCCSGNPPSPPVARYCEPRNGRHRRGTRSLGRAPAAPLAPAPTPAPTISCPPAPLPLLPLPFAPRLPPCILQCPPLVCSPCSVCPAPPRARATATAQQSIGGPVPRRRRRRSVHF